MSRIQFNIVSLTFMYVFFCIKTSIAQLNFKTDLVLESKVQQYLVCVAKAKQFYYAYLIRHDFINTSKHQIKLFESAQNWDNNLNCVQGYEIVNPLHYTPSNNLIKRTIGPLSRICRYTAIIIPLVDFIKSRPTEISYNYEWIKAVMFPK